MLFTVIKNKSAVNLPQVLKLAQNQPHLKNSET